MQVCVVDVNASNVFEEAIDVGNIFVVENRNVGIETMCFSTDFKKKDS